MIGLLWKGRTVSQCICADIIKGAVMSSFAFYNVYNFDAIISFVCVFFFFLQNIHLIW